MRPGLTLRLLAFNSSRPLFREQPEAAAGRQLRARPARAGGVRARRVPATDQLLPPRRAGFRDANIYPLAGQPRRAAKSSRAASCETARPCSTWPTLGPLIRTAQLIKEQLAKIGLEVEIRSDLPGACRCTSRSLTQSREAEWDIAFLLWAPNIPDAHEY